MWSVVSFVKRGKIRIEALKRLVSPKTPTDMAMEIGKHRSAVSRAILDLEKEGLVKCLTPNEKVCRLYMTTKKGKNALALMEKISGKK